MIIEICVIAFLFIPFHSSFHPVFVQPVPFHLPALEHCRVRTLGTTPGGYRKHDPDLLAYIRTEGDSDFREI